jgi:putative membrane protein
MSEDKESKERTALAEERTEWADQRTHLAQQRTFSGWMRTGFTSLAVGFGTIEFLREVQPAWLITGIGLILIMMGGIIPVLAYINYRKVEMNMKKAEKPRSAIPRVWVLFLTISMIMASFGGVLLVLGNNQGG